MKLYGSTTSPFVRRIRLLLADRDYEFINLDIFSPEGREELRKCNPTMKVPALVDSDNSESLCIYDSRIIFNYLTEKLSLTPLTWSQQNTLTLIDAANDSLVTMLLSERSKLPVEQDVMFFNLQKERLTQVFSVLEKTAQQGDFEQWHYASICLYALLDWAIFRDLYNFDKYPALQKFYDTNQTHMICIKTDPRC